MALKLRSGRRSETGIRKMLLRQELVSCQAVVRILRRQRAAPDQETKAALFGIDGDLFPEEIEDGDVSVFSMNARSSKFKNGWSVGLEATKIKFLVTVVSEVFLRCGAALKSVGADDYSGRFIANDEVFTDLVELVSVEIAKIRMIKSFIQFHVEDLKPEGLGVADLRGAAC